MVLTCASASVGIHAQTPGSVTLPASTAVGVGLGAAANYKIGHDRQWRDYEDFVIIAALNRVVKIASNLNQPATTATYLLLINQLRPALDAKSPQNPVFPDETAIVRYAIDSLSRSTALANSGPLLLAALARLDNDKFNQLELPINTIPLYPAEVPLYTVAAAAYGFIADEIQDASDLAHNSPTYASAVNTVLRDLIGLDSTNSYADIQQLYPNAVPNLPLPNSDGSFTLAANYLANQYCGSASPVTACQSQSVVGVVETIIQNDLNNLQAMAHVTHSALSLQSNNHFPGCQTPPGGIGPVLPADVCSTANPDSWTQAQSVITGIAKLVGITNSPQIGTQLQTAGNAVIQAGKAIDTIDQLIQVSGILGSDAAFAALNPVGGLVSAGMAIFSLFSPSNSNPNAAVLQGLSTLSTQIATLQTYISAQFQLVDTN